MLNGAAANGRQPFEPSFRDGPKDQTRNDGLLRPQPRRLRVFAEIVHTEVGQLAFQAFDVEPQRPAMAEQQQRATAGRLAGMEFDPDQFQHSLRLVQIDTARLACQHPVEAQRRDQAARGGSARQCLLPVEPVHADHQAPFILAQMAAVMMRPPRTLVREYRIPKEVLAEHKGPEPLDIPPHILEGRKGEPSKVAMA